MFNRRQQKITNDQSSTGKTAGDKAAHLADNRKQSAPLQRKSNNTGLPDNLKSGIENLSGHSMDDVKVHYNSSAPAQLNAHAYAQGTNIHVAPGQEKHLPHEAWHVVQQKQGRVKPTTQLKSKGNLPTGQAGVNDDHSLEKEADVMGAKAVSNEHTKNIGTGSYVRKELNVQPAMQWKENESVVQENHTQPSWRNEGLAAAVIHQEKVQQLQSRVSQGTVVQLASTKKKTKGRTISGHGGLRRNLKKKKKPLMTFTVPGGKSVMRPAPPGATLGDLSMFLNENKGLTREMLIKQMMVSTNDEIWTNKKVARKLIKNQNIPKSKTQMKGLKNIVDGNELTDFQRKHLEKLESHKEFEKWAQSHVERHAFKTFKEGEEMEDMVLTPFESHLKSNNSHDENKYVNKKTFLSNYVENTDGTHFTVNGCTHDEECPFTGFQLDKRKKK